MGLAAPWHVESSWCGCVLSCFSHVQLLATLWTEAHQCPLSVEFFRQEYWTEYPCLLPSPEDLPNPGIKPTFLASSALHADSFFFFFNWRLITLQHCSGFCHILKSINLEYTCVPHPESPSHLPPHPIPLGCPSAPAFHALFDASNLDWWSISHMVIYIFQCYSLKSSLPRLLPRSPKVCFLHLCLFCCLTCRVIITIFLNSIYMHWYTVLVFFFLTYFTLYNRL